MIEYTRRAAIYARVSTDDQTVQSQIEHLTEVAQHRGWQIVAIYKDEGISGAKGRDKRPGLNNLLNDAQRRKYDIVMAWHLDRIGRSTIDVLNNLGNLTSYGVHIYLDKLNIDTTTPTGKFFLTITAGLAELEREMIRERIRLKLTSIQREISRRGKFTTKAGIVRTKLGRPGAGSEKLQEARSLLLQGMGINRVAKQLGLGNQTVAQVKQLIQARPNAVLND